MKADPLAQLEDIHLPEAVSNWPAPGWWLLAVLVLASVAGAAIWLWRYRQRNYYRRLASKQLQQLWNSSLTSGDFSNYCEQANALVKRTALTAFPRQQVAALYGESWVDFLALSGAIDKSQLTPLAELYSTRQMLTQDQCFQLHQQLVTWLKRHRELEHV